MGVRELVDLVVGEEQCMGMVSMQTPRQTYIQTPTDTHTHAQVFDDRDVLDTPMSWCDKLIIPRERYRDRYPGHKKVIRYKGALVEKYRCVLPALLIEFVVYFNGELSPTFSRGFLG